MRIGRWATSDAGSSVAVGPRRAHGLAWICLVALVVAAPALLGLRTFGPESLLDSDWLYRVAPAAPRPLVVDPSRLAYDLPREMATAEGLLEGRLDAWNPRIGVGIPLWSEGGSPFFPLRLPFLLAPSLATYDLATALRLVVAGMGAYLLGRRRHLGRTPAAAGAIVFELSGAILTTFQFGTGAPPCLLPWVVLGADEIARRQTASAAAASGVALGLTAWAGNPMLAVVVFAGFGAVIAGHALAAWRTPRLSVRMCSLSVLAVGLGLAIAAPAFLPLLELQRVGRLYKHVLPFQDYAALWIAYNRRLAPLALVAPHTMVEIRGLISFTLPYCLSPVIGFTSLVFALAGFRRRVANAGLLALLLLGIAMTLAPPGLAVLRRLPLLRDVWPSYWWSLVALPLSLAAGAGVACLESPRERRWILIGLATVVAAVPLVLLLTTDVPHELPVLALRLPSVLSNALARPAGLMRLLLPTALATAAIVMLVVGRPRWLAAHRGAMATLLIGAELIAGFVPAFWHAPTTALKAPPSPALAFLQREMADGRYRMLGSTAQVGTPSTPSLFGLSDVRSVAALPPERYVRYLEAISPGLSWFFRQAPNTVRHPLLDRAAVRFLVFPQGAGPPAGDPSVRLAYRDARVSIYETAAALPRARIVHGALPVADADEAVRGLTEDDVDPQDRIVVEPADHGQPAPASAGGPPGADEVARILEQDDPDRVDLDVVLTRPGWVVLADLFYPGWTASVDGITVPIHAADLLFRAVQVPAGNHRVVFRYRPFSSSVGLVLAGFGFVACAILLFRDRGLTSPIPVGTADPPHGLAPERRRFPPTA